MVAECKDGGLASARSRREIKGSSRADQSERDEPVEARAATTEPLAADIPVSSADTDKHDLEGKYSCELLNNT